MMLRPPMLFCILDGWGVDAPGPWNAVAQAQPKTYQRLMKRYPSALLSACGASVGLPPRQVGNSEAGHMNLGAGRIVKQDAVRINTEIANGLFFRNPAFREALDHCTSHRSSLHLMGLLSGTQSGHTFPSHILALLKLARSQGNPQTYLHLFTDGRDTTKNAAPQLLTHITKRLNERQQYATVMGRLYGLDRAKRWSRTERAYHAIVLGKGRNSPTIERAIADAYRRGETDEFIDPTVLGLTPTARKASRVRHGDSVIFFNLRSDRARQITKAFVQPRFERMNPGAFRRKKILREVRFVAMTDFGPDLPNVLTAYPSMDIHDTLVHALGGLRQLYIAESEKFAHVTFFFNGGHASAVAGEDRLMIPSADVASFDEAPQMSTQKITQSILTAMKRTPYDVVVANFANADMVGHTGNIPAGVRAVRTIDRALARLVPVFLKRGGFVVLTSDHGNIEVMRHRKTGVPDTEHNDNPVPFCVISEPRVRLRPRGILADVAPTILSLFQKKVPRAMTGHSLLRP